MISSSLWQPTYSRSVRNDTEFPSIVGKVYIYHCNTLLPGCFCHLIIRHLDYSCCALPAGNGQAWAICNTMHAFLIDSTP